MLGTYPHESSDTLPAAEDDGITLSVPLLLLPQLVPGELDWTIPGWQREKFTALLEQLPRAQRKQLGPVPDLVDRLEKELVPFRGPMIPALARAASRLCWRGDFRYDTLEAMEAEGDVS